MKKSGGKNMGSYKGTKVSSTSMVRPGTAKRRGGGKKKG